MVLDHLWHNHKLRCYLPADKFQKSFFSPFLLFLLWEWVGVFLRQNGLVKSGLVARIICVC